MVIHCLLAGTSRQKFKLPVVYYFPEMVMEERVCGGGEIYGSREGQLEGTGEGMVQLVKEQGIHKQELVAD